MYNNIIACFKVNAVQWCWNIDMYQINGQTVLEEKYDENYEPTEEGAY